MKSIFAKSPLLLVLLLVAALFGLAGCGDGPAEEAGENIDEATENAAERMEEQAEDAEELAEEGLEEEE